MKKTVRNELINSMIDFILTVFGGISAPPSKFIVGQACADLGARAPISARRTFTMLLSLCGVAW